MKESSKHSNFITGALLISLGGLFAKILGALYRIPLTNIIGSYGMGVYQLIFPPYILFLTVAQAGIPVSLSRVIAEKTQLGDEKGAKKVFRFCLILLGITGFTAALLITIFSVPLANAEGNIDTATCFVIVAPALVFSPLTSVIKNYFQGKMNMLPSSITTVIEQIVKLAIGLSLAYYFMPNVIMAVKGAVLAITISEFVSLVIMSVVYLVHAKKHPIKVQFQKGDAKQISQSIFSLCLPIALGAFVMQMSQVVDSVMVVNLLTVADATSMYGLWTGPVNSMLGLPLAVSSGVAVSALPSITKTYVEGDHQKLRASYNSAFKLTMVIALPCAFGMIALSRPILSMLYGSLPDNEIYISAMLLSMSGMSIVFLAIMLTAVAVFQALGKPYVAVYIFTIAIVVKAAVNLILLPIPQINIYGAAISETLCYLFACICVIIYTNKGLHLPLDMVQCILKPLASALVMTIALAALTIFASSFVNTTLGTLFTIGISGVVYVASLFLFKVFDSNELSMMRLRFKKAKN